MISSLAKMCVHNLSLYFSSCMHAYNAIHIIFGKKCWIFLLRLATAKTDQFVASKFIGPCSLKKHWREISVAVEAHLVGKACPE